MSDNLVLNTATLKQILDDMGEDADLLLDTAFDSLQDYIAQLKNRGPQTTQEELVRYVHSMKSTAGSIGGEALYHMAAHYEASLKQVAGQDIDAIAADLSQAYAALQQAISAIR